MENTFYQVALGLIPGIGPVHTRELVNYYGSAENVFRQSKNSLRRIPGVGQTLANSILNRSLFHQTEEVINMTQKSGSQLLFFTDQGYPERLRNIPDAPSLICYRGNANLNHSRIIGLTGSRHATSSGRDITERIITELAPYDPVIISGLSTGIDLHAQDKAQEAGLATIAVMSGAANIMQPATRRVVTQMRCETGGMIADYSTTEVMDPSGRIRSSKTRIMSGLSDAVIVIETAEKSGSYDIAEIAYAYNKEVYAVPGLLGTKFSQGCNKLIRDQKANIFTSAEDIAYVLEWNKKKDNRENRLFIDSARLTEEQKQIAELLIESDEMDITDLSYQTRLSARKVASILLQMEMSGVVREISERKYKLGVGVG